MYTNVCALLPKATLIMTQVIEESCIFSSTLPVGPHLLDPASSPGFLLRCGEPWTFVFSGRPTT